MALYKREIEELESHLSAIAPAAGMNPQSESIDQVYTCVRIKNLLFLVVLDNVNDCFMYVMRMNSTCTHKVCIFHISHRYHRHPSVAVQALPDSGRSTTDHPRTRTGTS